MIKITFLTSILKVEMKMVMMMKKKMVMLMKKMMEKETKRKRKVMIM